MCKPHVLVAFIAVTLLVPHVASAQQQPAPPPPQAQPAPTQPTDGVRFRGAIAASGGYEFGDNKLGFGLAGLDGRLGLQINNLFGFYVQPSLAFGAGSYGGASGATGTAGVTGLVDFTFVDRIFVAAGGGAGVLNNPAGPELHFRVGGYPLVGKGENGFTRKGLMVGVDVHLFFMGTPYNTVPQIMGSIGYEVF